MSRQMRLLLPPSVATQLGEVDRSLLRARRRGSLGNSRPGRQSLHDRLHHPIEVVVDFGVPEPKNCPTAAFQRKPTAFVMSALVTAGMSRAVKLYCDPERHNREVDNIRTDRMLNPELPSAELLALQTRPEHSLGVGEFPPQRLRALARRPVGLHRETPSVSRLRRDPPPPVCDWWRQDLKPPRSI
jgi:hypothetical protein